MPALARSIEQLSQSINLLGKMLPMALGARDAREETLTPQNRQSRAILAQFSRRRAFLNARVERIAASIRAQTNAAARGRRALNAQRYEWGRQLVSLAPDTDAVSLRGEGAPPSHRVPAPPQVSGASTQKSDRRPSRARGLRLFSPEKAMSMLAPELESGGLLDPISRGEIFSAISEMSERMSARSMRRATRRVRTSFGTLVVTVDNGKVVVDAEEISSNAPGVRLSTAATSRLSTAATTRTSGAATKGLRRQVFSALPTLEVHLGRQARAERVAKVRLDPIRGEELPAAPSPRRSSTPAAQLSAPSTSGLVKVFVESDQAERIVKSLTMMRALEPIHDASTPRGGAPTRMAPQRRQLKNLTLERALSAFIDGRATAMSRPSPPTRDVSRPSATSLVGRNALTLQALSGPLSEASDARVIGALGKVAMARPAIGDLSRADLAQVLPYLQRDALISRQVQALAAARSEAQIQSRAAALASAIEEALEVHPLASTLEEKETAAPFLSAEALVEESMSMGRSHQWLEAATRMRLETLKPASAQKGGSAPLRKVSSKSPSRTRPYSGTPTLGSLLKQTGSISRLRSIGRISPSRPGAIEQSMSVPRALGDLPNIPGIVTTQRLAPAAFGGAILKEIEAVKNVLRPALKAKVQSPRALVSATAPHPGRTTEGPAKTVRPGQAGIWFPEGVQRLLQTTTERIISHGDIEATLLAPSLFSTSGPEQSPALGTKSHTDRPLGRDLPSDQTASRELAAMSRRTALNLKRHGKRSGVGRTSLSLGVGRGHGGPNWMTQPGKSRDSPET
jgi:hypothetical protein